MKKIIIPMLILLMGTGTTTKLNAQEPQLSKKELKAQRKAQEAAEATYRYETAMNAIKEGKFVLEADKITFKRGQFVYVTSFTNFIMVNGEKATVQLAFNTMRSGPNGIGGITVDGTISNAKIKTTKRGDLTYTFAIQGIGISAQVSMRLNEGDNTAEADVNPNFNSNRTTMSGVIVPLEESSVFKGRSL
ncbi:DUF4251 domain-containing protein [Bacteroides sp. 51]|uniref:DUF4251 domain-containing protein n=1 Tax=Bacteroides sp. 51 TaxID=2302938 RepID=UPI0013D64F6B|nr:DUF4251 domain-containing protein [Bacteroides sp. 51]NDV83470.1 DUF4251 domain-containing protein [Bacteroides sp. 51]